MIRGRVISAVCDRRCCWSRAVLWLPPFWSAGGPDAWCCWLAAWEWSGFLAAGAWRAAAVRAAVPCVLCAAVVGGSSRDAGPACAAVGCAARSGALALLWVIREPAAWVDGAWSPAGGLLALSLAWLALVRMRIDWPQGGHAGDVHPAHRVAGRTAAPTSPVAPSGAASWRPRCRRARPGPGLWGGFAACALLALAGRVGSWQVPLVPLLAVTLVAGVFTVDRNDGAAGAGSGGQHQRPCHDQRLLVGNEQALAGHCGGQGRRQPRGTHDGRHHIGGIRLPRHLHQRLRPSQYRLRRPAAANRLASCGASAASAIATYVRPEFAGLRCQQLDVAAGRQCYHAVPIGMTPQDIQRGNANAAGGAQHGHPDQGSRAETAGLPGIGDNGHARRPGSSSTPSISSGAAASRLSKRSSTPP